MNYRQQKQTVQTSHIDRTQVLKVALIVLGVIILARLFYVQIIRHEYYQAQAIAEHLKKFEIPASRGLISVRDGTKSIPLVLNEPRYTIFADPKLVTDSKGDAAKLVTVIGGDEQELAKKLADDNRYVVLAKKMTKEQTDRILALKIKGVASKEYAVRTYPQASLAAQVLGFVNDEGKGQYGVESYLDTQLAGETGLQKAVTDVNGIPLAVNNDNVAKQPQAGEDVTLSIDIGMQRLLEEKLKQGVDSTKATRGSAILLEANTGAIKAMANYPTYDPSQFESVKDQALFSNTATMGSWEPGSVIKPLLMATALNEGAVTTNFSYFDSGSVTINGKTIKNALPYGAQTMTVYDVIQKSLNTGVVKVLRQLGDGEITLKARQTYYNYLTDKFKFGTTTGIEQAGETEGLISEPDSADAPELRYANMAFGQGMTATPIQVAAAYAAIVNGGTYYRPSLVYSTTKNGQETIRKPEVVASNVVSSETSKTMREMLRRTLEANNSQALRSGYILGAKSGTAEVAGENGVYQANVYNGTYVGYIGGDEPKYILLVRLDNPKGDRFASTSAARVWAWTSNALIDSFSIQPKR